MCALDVHLFILGHSLIHIACEGSLVSRKHYPRKFYVSVILQYKIYSKDVRGSERGWALSTSGLGLNGAVSVTL